MLSESGGLDEYIIGHYDVFLTVDMYVRGIWDKDRAVSEIRFYETSHQICLIRQNLIGENFKLWEGGIAWQLTNGNCGMCTSRF